MYYVFVSNTYRYNDQGDLVPAPRSREHVIAKNIGTEAEAQQLVRDHDATHKPGKLGRYAKYDHQRK